MIWRLDNATLDGGLFLWFINAYEAVLHAAEAERGYVQTGLTLGTLR